MGGVLPVPVHLHRQLVTVAENRRIRPLLLGVSAGVIGLIAVVPLNVLQTGVVDVPTRSSPRVRSWCGRAFGT